MTTDREAARTDLADLVRERMAELGISIRTLATRTVDPHPELQPEGERKTGPLWARTTLQDLLNGAKTKAPTPAELRALAHGLECSVTRVSDAAVGQFFDLDVFYNRDKTVRAIIRHAEGMTEEQRLKLLEWIEDQ